MPRLWECEAAHLSLVDLPRFADPQVMSERGRPLRQIQARAGNAVGYRLGRLPIKRCCGQGWVILASGNHCAAIFAIRSHVTSVDLGANMQNEAFVSITHLRPEPDTSWTDTQKRPCSCLDLDRFRSTTGRTR